jgi:proline iminopeptidase
LQVCYGAIMAAFLLPVSRAGEETPMPPEPKPRETVLDRVVHVEKEIVKEIPRVPPLCEELKMAGQRIDVGGCKLYCEIEGEGEGVPLVLINGGPGGTHHYFHPWFARAKKFAKIVYYDQRGCGQSDYEKDKGYSVDQAADDLESLRKALKLDKWIVLGHSYGGLLAQCYMAKYPDAVAGVVLVGSAEATKTQLKPTRQFDYLSTEEREAIRAAHNRRDLPLDVKLYNAWLNGDWKRQCFYKPTPDEFARVARYEWKHDGDFNSVMSRDSSRINLRGVFDGCPLPTLIIEGKYDLTWNTDKPEVLHRNHPGSKLVMFERSAHGPFMDEPEKFFQELQEFVTKLPPVAPEELAKWKAKTDGLLQKQRAALECSRKLDQIPWTGGGAQALELYKESVKSPPGDATFWFMLGMKVYDGEHYEAALDSFRRIGDSEKTGVVAFAGSAWQGIVLDLLGRRDEAVQAYKEALKRDAGHPMQNDQYGLVIDKKWLEARLEKPYERKK